MTRLKTDSVTIREVARRAGVSVATVSRFINQTVPVSEAAAGRVQAAMTELMFVPHAVARRLATSRTNTIGLLLTDIQGDFFTPMLSGIETVAREAGYDLLISTSGKPGPRRAFPLPLGPHNTDGMLVFVNSLDQDGLAHYHELNFPMVLIHRSSPNGMNIPSVTVENKAASKKIITHLIKAHNRRQIVYLSGPHDQEDSSWREEGYRVALEAHGIPFNSTLVVPGDFDRYVAANSMRYLLGAGVKFDAVFSGDDEAAVGVMEALHEAGKGQHQWAIGWSSG